MTQKMEKYYGFRVKFETELDPFKIGILKDKARKILYRFDIDYSKYLVFFHHLNIFPNRRHFGVEGINNRIEKISLRFSINLKQRKNAGIKFLNHEIAYISKPNITFRFLQHELIYEIEAEYFKSNLSFENEIVTIIDISKVKESHRKIKASVIAYPSAFYNKILRTEGAIRTEIDRPLIGGKTIEPIKKEDDIDLKLPKYSDNQNNKQLENNLKAEERYSRSQEFISLLKSTPSGTENALKYQSLIVDIFDFAFYGLLQNSKTECDINDGRKRIDIIYERTNEPGIFKDIAENYNIFCPYIFVECKNYSHDIANPEIDQLGLRFSDRRGQFGLIVCRAIEKMDLVIKKCQDIYKDNIGLIIPLVDEDLIAILSDIGTQYDGEEKGNDLRNKILKDRCGTIVIN